MADWNDKGHDGLEDAAKTARKRRPTPKVRKRVSTSAATAAAAKAVSTAARASMTNADHVVSAMRKIMASGKTETTLRELETESGQSFTYVRMMLNFHADVLKANGLSATIGSGGTVTLAEIGVAVEETEDAAPAPTPTPHKKKVTKAKVERDLFIFNETIKTKIKAVLAEGGNFWLAGPTGTGKTEYYTRILEELKIEPIKMSANGESSTDELLGHYAIVDGDTVEVVGALERAMTAGVPLILEEIDTAPAEVNMALQAVLEIRDDNPRSYYNAKFQRRIVAKPGFCVLATANTTGGGDHTGLYLGTQPQNAAFRDRFCFEVVGYADEETEIEILVRRTGLAAAIAKKAVQFATAIRQQIGTGEFTTPVSTRTLLAFANYALAFEKAGMARDVAVLEALKSSALYKASSDTERDAYGRLAQRIFGFAVNV